MASPEQLAEYRKLALLSDRIGKHGPNKKNLLRKEARERALEEMKEMYKAEALRNLPDIVNVHMEKAKDAESGWKDREYVLSEFVGEAEKKAEKHLHLEFHKHEELGEAGKKLIEEYEAKLKELKTQ